MQNAPLIIFCFLLNWSTCLSGQDSDLDVFNNYRGDQKWLGYQGLNNTWYNHLSMLAYRHIEARKQKIDALTTREAWVRQRKSQRESLLKSIGGLPAKTPLNPQITGRIEKEDFLVEKLIYESLPQFYVTACLFLPKKMQGPAPAVIYCSGHSAESFRSETYQRVILNLVNKGFIVLAFDPIGQGERFQYLDKNGEPNIGGATNEHSYAGLPSLLSGNTIAKYMIHDGIRAVDYLLTRPEVDSERIGITGRSGGGTQSAYIAAFDDRIYASAPENYITSFKRIWQSIGPQDAEQNLPNAHVLGIDHADLLEVRAPKPTLILTTSRDFFSIQGARETIREVKKVYRYFDASDNIGLTEDDHGHGSTKKNREAMNAFFLKHLRQEGDPVDEDLPLLTKAELTITESGQVLTALNGKTVFDLNRETLPSERIQPTRKDIVRVLDASISEEAPNPVYTGGLQKNEYRIEKYFLEFAEGRYPIPLLWIVDRKLSNPPVVLYLDDRGKSSDLLPNGPIEQLVKSGYAVLAPDLLNIGELGSSTFRGDSHIDQVSFNLVWGSSLVGSSLVELQTADLLAIGQYLQNHHNTMWEDLTIFAKGGLQIPALHLAALQSNPPQLILNDTITSWIDLVNTRRYEAHLAYSIVPGALQFYDIPDLLQIIGSEKVIELGNRELSVVLKNE